MTTIEQLQVVNLEELPDRRAKALLAIQTKDERELIGYINDASATIEQQAARISELEQRLEVDPGHPYDGIACRNVTIRELERVIDDRDRYIRKIKHHADVRKKAVGAAFSAVLDAGLTEGIAEAQMELDRLNILVDKLQLICASAYQMAGLVGAPVRFLDVLANPLEATQDQIDTLLPVREDEVDALRESGLLKSMVETVMSIPKMSDEDLALLQSNCRAVIDGGKRSW